MARGGRSSSGGTGIGPYLGLGVGAVSVNSCTTSDTSFFCQFSRIFQMIMWVFTLLFIAWVLFTIIPPMLGKRGRGYAK
jgi:hypothetical protein